MQQATVIITNVHPRGFSFGMRADNGEAVFIPPMLSKKLSPTENKRYDITLVPNIGDRKSENVPWKAAALIEAEAVDPNYVYTPEMAEMVQTCLSDSDPWTAAEIAEDTGLTESYVRHLLFDIAAFKITLSDHTGAVEAVYYTYDRNAAVTFFEGSD